VTEPPKKKPFYFNAKGEEFFPCAEKAAKRPRSWLF
jgi:hypothetical protein